MKVIVRQSDRRIVRMLVEDSEVESYLAEPWFGHTSRVVELDTLEPGIRQALVTLNRTGEGHIQYLDRR